MYTFGDHLLLENWVGYIEKLGDDEKKKLKKALDRIREYKGKSVWDKLRIQLFRDLMDKDPEKTVEVIHKWDKMPKPPFSTTTNLPSYDEMLEDPEYFANNKGWYFEIVRMDPEKYLRESKLGFRMHAGGSGNFTPDQKLVVEYANRMIEGERAPIPILRYVVDGKGNITDFTQEGRHRAAAADYLGIPNIPVVIAVWADEPGQRKEEAFIQEKDRILNRFG